VSAVFAAITGTHYVAHAAVVIANDAWVRRRRPEKGGLQLASHCIKVDCIRGVTRGV
jgi:hypothetical protein